MAPAEIAAKTGFLSSAFVLLIGTYGLALLVTALIHLLQRPRRDPLTVALESGMAVSFSMIVVFFFVVAAATFALAVHGFGAIAPVDYGKRNADPIIETNFAFWRSLAPMGFSLFCALLLPRYLVCLAAAATPGAANQVSK